MMRPAIELYERLGVGRRLRPPVVIAVAVVGAVGASLGWWFGASPSSASAPASTTVTATVERRDLAAQFKVDGTLGYAGEYQVTNQSHGIVTWLPDLGEVVSQGGPLYRVGSVTVPLFYGDVPMYRDLAPGDSGPDVRQLNRALVDLGYDGTGGLDPDSDTYTWRTRAAVQAMQDKVGVDVTGRLALGAVVFLPGPARVTRLAAVVGGSAIAGQPVMTASSTRHQVTVALDVAYQERVAVGDVVTITLPGGSTTPGVVASVGTVATIVANSNGSDGDATIEVLVDPEQPDRLGTLDRAPVRIAITTAEQADVLVVPLAALLARPGGTYAVDVVHDDGSHQLIDVELGLVDDANSRVAVSGEGLTAGQKVVVPAT